MKATQVLFLLAVVIPATGCHRKEEPVPMPQADFAKISRRWNSMSQWTFHKNQQLVNIGIDNPTRYEIATITADLILMDESGNPVETKEIVCENFVDLASEYKGSLMPDTTARSIVMVPMEAPKRFDVKLKSATYFAKGDDLSDQGHLFAAVYRGDNEAVKKAVKNDPALRTGKDPATGLALIHEAAASNNLELTTFLVDGGVDYDAPNSVGVTPVLLALNGGAGDTAVYLIDKGAKLDTKKNQPTALEIAADRCPGKVIDKLVEKGQDPNHLPAKRANALQIAAGSGNEEAAIALIKNGANINYKDNAHTQPIFFAITSGNPRMVTLLIEHGAGVNEPNAKGYTPIMIAAAQSNFYVVEALLKRGASPGAPSPEGKTALDYARQNGNQEAIEALTNTKG
jgi:ankyrin repeat protein